MASPRRYPRLWDGCDKLFTALGKGSDHLKGLLIHEAMHVKGDAAAFTASTRTVCCTFSI